MVLALLFQQFLKQKSFQNVFTDIKKYKVILTDIYLNCKEYWLISVCVGHIRLILVHIGLLNFLP